MRGLSWFEAFLVGLTLAFLGLLGLGLVLSTSRLAALTVLGTFAAIATLTVLVKLVSRLERRKEDRGDRPGPL